MMCKKEPEDVSLISPESGSLLFSASRTENKVFPLAEMVVA